MGLSAQQTNLSSVTKTAQLEEFTRKWEDGAVKSDALDSTITNNRFVETKYLATSSTVNNKTVEDSSVPASTSGTKVTTAYDTITTRQVSDASGSTSKDLAYGTATSTASNGTITGTNITSTTYYKVEDMARLNISGTSGATVKTETEDAITQKRISGDSVVNLTIDTATAREVAKTATVAELTGGTYKANDADKVLTSVTSTDTSGDILKDLAYGTATSTAYDSTTSDLKGDVYTSSPPYASTTTESTWKDARIDALTATVAAWSSSNSDFAGITDMTGKVTNDVATLCTADIKTDIFSCLR